MERVGTKQRQQLQQEQPQPQQQHPKVKAVGRRKGNSKANLKSGLKQRLPTNTTTTAQNVGYTNVKQRISMGVASMNNMSSVFQKLFDTLEAEHVKLQALESRRIQLTEEMHVLHEMLKKQNQQLRSAERQHTDRKNRVTITDKMPLKSTAAAAAEAGTAGTAETVPKPSNIVTRSPSMASASSRRKGSAAAKSASAAKATGIIVKNAGTAGILSKSGSKIPKTFSLNSPPSKTTTFTVGSPPSQPGSVMGLKTPAGAKAAKRSSIASFGSATSKVTSILSKSSAAKVVPSKLNAVAKPFTMVKSIKINDPSKTSMVEAKPSVVPKTNLKVPPKPAIKKGFHIKKSGENIAMAGARLLGINKLVKNIIAVPRTTPPPPPPPPPFTTLAGMALPPFATPITPNRKDSGIPARAVAAATAAAAAASAAAAAATSTTSTAGVTATDSPVIDSIVTPQTSENAVDALPPSTSITSDQEAPGTVLKRTARSENFTEKKRSKVNDATVRAGSPPKTPPQQQSSVHIIEKPRKLPETSSLQLEVSTPPTEQIIQQEPTHSSDAKIVVPLPKESKRKVPQLDASQTQQEPQPIDEAPSHTTQSKEPQLKESQESRNPRPEDSS